MKKQQPQISEDKILAMSWALLGEAGIEKFSMRRLADRLGIQAPSLYWHFKSKQAIYLRLANQVSRIILESHRPHGDWKEQLQGMAVAIRNVLSQYPCSTQLMMSTLPHEPDIIRFNNRMLLCVESTPLQQVQKLQVVLTLMNYVFNFILDDYEHQRNVAAIMQEEGETALPGGRVSRLLDSMDEEEAGLFRSMYKNKLFEMMGTDAAFEFGLQVILLGVEQMIQQQMKQYQEG
ncbi:TetR/AcrR family transcriptional regulator [Paenibacillus sp. SYP-B4298]|uniref:TetR/AcrR family transcriptional regulator n=1 Tax=Paenibacillus sp. SYP-B4298 TaxID=2996034 RepID=UPI0022DD1A06|nr:TetR/AcrR family transcriptional regulator C-terminal domain-containing protein [Paenibacillus sp. SYP-B4298]